MKRGDAIAAVAQPIARTLDFVAGTNVAGCGGCKQMRDNLNSGMSLSNAIYERWFKAKETGEKMKYQMVIVVEADKFTEAVQKAEAIGDVLSAQLKPEPPQRTQTGGVPPRPQ